MEKQRDLKGIELVLFDLDGTLIKLDLNVDRIRKRLHEFYLSKYGIDMEFKPVIQKIEEAESKIINKKEPKKTAKKSDLIKKEAYNIIEEEEIKAVKGSRLLPYTKEIIEVLKHKKIKIGIVSRNGKKAVHRSLEYHGINKFEFDIIIAREDVKKNKPHPDPVFKALEGFSIIKEKCIMVGDHPYDIEMGKKAGILTVGVVSGKIPRKDLEKQKPDYIINNLAEFGELLS